MIIEKLYADEYQPRSGFQPGVLRMSSADACTRAAAYTQLGYEEKKGDRADVRQVVMQDGDLHERDVVRRLLLKGFNIWNYGEGQAFVTVQQGNNFWRGHPDLFIEIGGKYYGLDVKGFRDEVFRMHTAGAVQVKPGIWHINDPMVMAEGSFPVMGQMQMYLHSEKAKALGVEEWIVLIKNKNTAELAECVIPKMPDYYDRIGDRWKGFWALIAAGRLPDRNFDRSSLNCKLCGFYNTCWEILEKLPESDGRVKWDHDPNVVERARLWREGKKYEKMAATRLELAKLTFIKIAAENGLRELSIDGLNVNVKQRSRRFIDSGYTQGLLEELLEQGHITDKQYDDCWDVTEYPEVRIADTRPITDE